MTTPLIPDAERARPDPWKLGDEFKPFHPQCSNVEPAYRDGWNACFEAARRELLARQVPAEPLHSSDCARHNAPAYPVGPCNCGADPGEALVAEVAAALELVRAQHIVAEVAALPMGGHDADMPTAFEAGYQLACEEIAERLKPAAPTAAGAEEASQWSKPDRAPGEDGFTYG